MATLQEVETIFSRINTYYPANCLFHDLIIHPIKEYLVNLSEEDRRDFIQELLENEAVINGEYIKHLRSRKSTPEDLLAFITENFEAIISVEFLYLKGHLDENKIVEYRHQLAPLNRII